MSKLFILVMMFLLITGSMAAERRSIRDIDIDAITKDTQVSPAGAGDEHVAFVWWVPIEFWQSILARDVNTSERDKNATLDALSGSSLIAIVQADVSSLGAFKFYSKDEVEKNMHVSFTNAGGEHQRLRPVQVLAPDLEVVLGVFKPLLSAAMGNLGANMHFYVFDDQGEAKPRLLDPYRKGVISVQLTKNDKEIMIADVELPLNALFFPRKCPNGKEAHVSWNYCPWSGKQLEE